MSGQGANFPGQIIALGHGQIKEREETMKIIEQSFKLTQAPGYNYVLDTIEQAARTCYQSEPKGDKVGFIRGLIKSGHESVIEHVNVGVEITTDRGVSHELVRHRVGVAYSQSSTRYCNYSHDRFNQEIKVIKPSCIKEKTKEFFQWIHAVEAAERVYMGMVSDGVSPQTARSVLPTCLATEICTTMNFRSWRHFFRLRTAPGAHPDMRRLAVDMLQVFRDLWPVFFEDV